MKLKIAAVLAVLVAGGLTAHAGLRVGFSLGSAGRVCGFRPAYASVCGWRYASRQPLGCAALPYFWYWNPGYTWGYGDGAPYVASFSAVSGDSAPIPVYQVPAPVLLPQPVKTYPVVFGWKQ